MKTTAENLLFWEQQITERVRNGMTIGEWCERNGVSKYQYYYWNRRVREKEEMAGETAFADIAPILSTTDIAGQNSVPTSHFQIFFKSIQVTVPGDFNPTALAGLMKVLQEL